MRYPEYMTAEDIMEFEYNRWLDELEEINLECQIVAFEQQLTESVVVL